MVILDILAIFLTLGEKLSGFPPLRMMLAMGFKSIKLYGAAALDNVLSKVQKKFSS